MAKPIEVPLVTNASKFLSGVKDAEKGLRDLEGEISDFGKEGSRDVDKVEESLSDLARKAKKAGDAGDDMGRDFDKGTDRAKKGIKDVGKEADSTAREAAASFSGSAEDVGDAFQELAANAGASFGPIGAAAGIVAGAGIGAITTALGDASEAADEMRARISEAYQAAAEEGRNFLDQAQIAKEVSEIYFGPDPSRYVQAQKDAEALGITVGSVVQAMAGDQDALNVVLTRTSDLEAERAQRISDSTNPLETRAELMTSEAQTLQNINDRFTTQKDIQQENINKANEVLKLSGENLIQIQKRNDELARTPQTVKTTLEVDDSAITRALYNRTLRIDVEGYTRYGNRVV